MPAEESDKEKNMRTVVVRSSFWALALALLLPATVFAGPVSSGGPWTYQTFYVTCRFSGDHGAQNNYAFARTTDYNGGCARLAVRLKSNPGPVDWGWVFSATSPASFTFFDPDSGTTAVSSEHRAQEGFQGSWSQIERPHAF
jgi:hypothetical protein